MEQQVMGLKIESIGFSDFRSYDHFELGEIGGLTIFIGRNAIGKTNILEGIQLLSAASSFRHPQISQLIREGCERSRIMMESGNGNRQLTTVLAMEAGKRRYTVNGKVRSISEIKGVLPSVSFIPDDLQLAKKTSSIKRQTLDELGVQVSKNYYVIRKDFEKALRYKNRLLKDEAPIAMIDAINETLVTCAAQLFCYRYALFNRMIPIVAEHYGRIAQSEEAFSAVYEPSWDRIGEGQCNDPLVEEAGLSDRDVVRTVLMQEMERHRTEELHRHRSLIGPHADRIEFYLAGKDASQFASQGQQRSIVLAWKLAEVEMVRRTLGTEPVLLLDDVMSELDETRRNMLVKNVSEETQTFITSTDLSPFNDELLSHARIVDLESL